VSISHPLIVGVSSPDLILDWSSLNATNVTLSGFGAVALNGNTNASPSQSTNYTATATGARGNVFTNVTVTIPAPPTSLNAP